MFKKVSKEFVSEIDNALDRHAEDIMGVQGKGKPHSYSLHEEGELMGTIVVIPIWGSLYIHKVYVNPKYRKRGIGKQLMEQAAQFAHQEGCALLYVETTSYQALDFYLKCGFTLDFTRDGYSHGISIHYLHRKIGL